MKKESRNKAGDGLRAEYDLNKLGPGVRGKYYRKATAGSNLVLIETDLADMFPDSDSVNRALRILAEAATMAKLKRRAVSKQAGSRGTSKAAGRSRRAV